MSFYETIRRLCTERNISVHQLEVEAGLSNGAVSKWKNSTPNSKTIKVLAEYFDVSLEFLLADNFEGCAVNASNLNCNLSSVDRDVLEVATLVIKTLNNPTLKALIYATENISKEDLEFVNQLVQKMAQK